MIIKIINFIILITLIIIFGRKSIVNFFRKAAQERYDALHEARSNLIKAEKQIQNFQQKIQTMENELEELKIQLMHEAEAERKKMIEEGKEKINHFQSQINAQIKHKISKAQQEWRQQLVTVATQQAEKQLQDQINQEKNQQIFNEFIEEAF